MIQSATPSQTPPLLVGREREQAMLRDHFAAALAGHGSLVLIGGEAGIGKTALAETICNRGAECGALVLTGWCFDLTETPPYGPWIELFRGYQTSGDLPPPDAFAERGTIREVTSQAVLFRQVQDFLTALTNQRSVILLLDDLHWADPASLDLLRYVARHLTSAPLLIVATYRTEEVTGDHQLATLLPALVREAKIERLTLQPLGDAAVRALLAARYPLPDADAARLVVYVQARAEGNPFFVRELLRTLEEEAIVRRTDRGEWALGDVEQVRVPSLVRQVIEGRLARLRSETQRLLAIAAAIGQDVPLVLWAAVAEADEETLLAVIEQATEASLMEETPDGMNVRFIHALIRETLYEGIRPTRRRGIHFQIAELLAAMPTPDPDAVAYHFQQASDDRALPWLLEAGGRAQAAYAWTTAAARFEAALALMEGTDADARERGWHLLRVSRLLRYVEVMKARSFADEAHALAEQVGDRALAAYARFQRGNQGCNAGDVAFGLSEMEAGAAALAALSATEQAHFAAHAAAITATSEIPDERGVVVLWRAFLGHFRSAQELGERLVAEADGGGDAALQRVSEALFGLGDAYAALGRPEAAAANSARGHEINLRLGQHAPATHILMRELELVALPYRAEEIAEVRHLAERAEAEWVRVSGAIPEAGLPHVVRLPLLVLEGRWQEAERLALVGSMEMQGLISQRAAALKHLASLTRLRGDRERAWWAIRELLPAGAVTEPGTVAFFDCATALQRVAALLALDAHDLPTARGWLEAHDYWLAWSGAVLGQSEGQTLWAQYYRAAGEGERAYDSAAQALTHATAPRQPLALLAAHRLLGELDTEAARFTDAQTHLNTALALADACQAPYERALTLLASAGLRAAENRRDEAVALLDEVRAICRPLDASPALARADALAARLAVPHPRMVTYPSGLSVREVEVLRLIVSGNTNQEIAALLSLSVRTVERHITSLYRKIDARGRADAIGHAVRHGLS